MDYVMVTFQTGEGYSKELKVPSFVTSEELLSMLSEALGLSITPEHRLQAEPLGRILDPSRTLEEEGVGFGALLTLI
ncbi:EsaB/YukD family protein [Paenibacillus ihumii]|uniref:EsaB/YukD family protein n=1 Tax=Paenibacillus ihumii TaxID=687436 RepID=UPI0006D826C2|nr:EsaB/YukD family protein [Paenibacillus ihumii]